ncbi:MAG: 50S ribosomal protein L3 [Erysipelotrichaceae bacterium]|nr:50S ribosomal protein L3 [Erysipelotrichaceae bacterium]
MKGLMGRKLGMTQVFLEDGTLIPVTVVEVTPNIVTQKKTVEKDGYAALQLGMEDLKDSKATKANKGHAGKAGTAAKRFYREVRSDEMADLEVGAIVSADLFEAGDKVDVQGISRGKGYMGAIYRNNQHMLLATHGTGPVHRTPGSFATIGRNNGIINKGKMMAGHEGVYTTTNQNLEIVKVDMENNCLLIKGNVPGPRKGVVVVKTTVKPVKHVEPANVLSYEIKEEA